MCAPPSKSTSTEGSHRVNQVVVDTPYGRGVVLQNRSPSNGNEEGMKEIRLLNPAQGQQSMLYSVEDFPGVKPAVGDDVICQFGRGRVISVVGKDKCVVKLTSWRLAGRSSVKCHLSPDAVQVVRKKTVKEMDAYEKVSYAQHQKERAAKSYSEKKYESALTTYAAAVDTIRFVQHDSSSNNELRADLLSVMITCCNNASTCCVQLSKWDEAVKFAKNALLLLNALHKKKGLKIHTALKRDGLKDEKVFGEWRVKSYLLMGRAMAEKGDHDAAIENLKNAKELIEEYTQDASIDPASAKILAAQDKDLKRLQNACAQRKKQEQKKEKKAAEAMFGDKGSKPKKKELPKMHIDQIDRGVSFSEKEEISHLEGISADQGKGWFGKHKEAILLTAAVGIAATAFTLLRRKK